MGRNHRLRKVAWNSVAFRDPRSRAGAAEGVRLVGSEEKLIHWKEIKTTRYLFVVLAIVAAILWQPREAAAGCNEGCIAITNQNGDTVGYGCITEPGTGNSCAATPLRCSLNPCQNTLLTDPQGAMLALATVCEGAVALRDVPVAPAAE